MKTNIVSVDASRPPTRVELDLSVEEFALIYRLYYHHLNGNNSLREAVADGLHDALDALPDGWRELVEQARDARKHGSHVANVADIFQER